MLTLAQGQAENLKHDTGTLRYWLMRCGVSDGATYAASIEMLTDGRWEVVDTYGEPFER
jgi:hypothetical protein